MARSPDSFADPGTYPVVFEKPLDYGIITYGQTGFPVTFIFDEFPRRAVFKSIVLTQLDSYFTSTNIYTDTSVFQFAIGETQTIQLCADQNNITTANFYITIPRDGTVKPVVRDEVASIRQPQFNGDISHTFSMSLSTWAFTPYNSGGTNYYPTVSLDLSFKPHLKDDAHIWTDISLPDKTDSSVMIAPDNVYGVLDIVATTKIRWYLNASRTILSPITPYSRSPYVFGFRFFVSKPSLFMFRNNITDANRCVSSGIYPTSVIEDRGGTAASVWYWGGGDVAGDIFVGEETDITISDAGLPVQDTFETAAYVLTNPLPEVGSSSSSSTSSLRSSSSSSSLPLESSSSSLSSFSSPSSRSSSSNSSSSSFSSSSVSSPSSSSPSSVVLTSSSSSSLGTESSYGDLPVLHYPFDVTPDVYGTVVDVSASGNDALIATADEGLGPPSWVTSGGIRGGCFLFSSNDAAYTTDYIYGTSFTDISGDTRGTLSLWVYVLPFGNPESVLFCISNGFESAKTELAVSVDRVSLNVKCWVVIDGVEQWQVVSDTGSISTGAWIYVALVHNGRVPKVYIDGVLANITFATSLNRRKWVTDLFSATSPADRLIIGGSPRHYYPHIALGLTGSLDEIKLWDVPLSSNNILADYEFSSSSSSSHSSASSSSTSSF